MLRQRYKQIGFCDILDVGEHLAVTHERRVIDRQEKANPEGRRGTTNKVEYC